MKQRIINFHKRWNIPLPDDEEQFLSFKNRALAKICQVFEQYNVLDLGDFSERFAYEMGIGLTTNDITMVLNDFKPIKDIHKTALYHYFYNIKTLPELIKAIQFLFWTFEKYNYLTKDINMLVKKLQEAIDSSPGINIRIIQRNKYVTLYPAGAKLLDEALVNETLAWLEDYPDVLKPFEAALLLYQSKDPAQRRNLLDNLRVALEQLLRKILRNNAPLEKQGGNVKNWIKEKGISPQVGNLYRQLLNTFAEYQDDAVKHGDKSTPQEIEFMIYLTGAFMRLLIQLNNEETR